MLPVSSLPLLVSPKNWVPNGSKCKESSAQQEKVMGSNPVQAKVFFSPEFSVKEYSHDHRL